MLISNFETLTKIQIQESLESKYNFYVERSGITLREYLFLKGKYSWDKNAIDMSLNRLAYYLIKEDINIITPNIYKNLEKLKLEKENGKNFTFYLLYHAKSKDTIQDIFKYYPAPKADYGLNPLELLIIKIEINEGLELSLGNIISALQLKYTNRFQI